MRSEEEIKRAIGALTGMDELFKRDGEELPQIGPTQLAGIYMALEWATGIDNGFSFLIETAIGCWKDAGIGVDDNGEPYKLSRTN